MVSAKSSGNDQKHMFCFPKYDFWTPPREGPGSGRSRQIMKNPELQLSKQKERNRDLAVPEPTQQTR